MSRGGRGGGRGGRGGGRGGFNTPWDNDPNLRGSAESWVDYPPMTIPHPSALDATEQATVAAFLLTWEQMHASPLYTHARAYDAHPRERRRAYGRDQVNARYGVAGGGGGGGGSSSSRATQDPFTAVPAYGDRFRARKRALPDLGGQLFNKHLFPAELHATLDGADGDRGPTGAAAAAAAAGGKRAKTLHLSEVTEVLGVAGQGEGEGGYERMQELLRDVEGDEDVDKLGVVDDEEDQYEGEEDEQYDDEDAGDYDGEQYFENGDDDDGDDFGGGGDDDVY